MTGTFVAAGLRRTDWKPVLLKPLPPPKPATVTVPPAGRIGVSAGEDPGRV